MFLFCLNFAFQRLVSAVESLHMIGQICCCAEGKWAMLSAARFSERRLHCTQ